MVKKEESAGLQGTRKKLRKNESCSPMRPPLAGGNETQCKKMHIEDFNEYRSYMERMEKESQA